MKLPLALIITLLWALLPLMPSAAFGANDTVLVGDMLVEKSSIENFSEEDISLRGALKLNAQLWEDGVLPVRFAAGTTSEQKELFMKACGQWQKVANVRCIEGAYKGRQLHVMRRPLGCFSLYGMGTNFLVARRVMNLEEKGCWHQATILHEIGHAFGLIHEHQRGDRDQYLRVASENVEKGFLSLNLKLNFGNADFRALTPYDFLSVMHYSRDAFSKNGKDTLIPEPEYRDFADLMGRQKSVSEGDAFALSALYGPPTGTP